MLTLLLFLVVVSLVFWLVPMDETLKKIFYAVVILVVVIWLIGAFTGGGVGSLNWPLR